MLHFLKRLFAGAAEASPPKSSQRPPAERSPLFMGKVAEHLDACGSSLSRTASSRSRSNGTVDIGCHMRLYASLKWPVI
jgi:hypothetical protein